MKKCFYFGIAILFLVLSGCAKNNTITHGNHPSSASTFYYKVQPHETLGSIASRYGLNYLQLAAMNDLRPPYAIHVGQVLAITPSLTKKQESPLPQHGATIGKVYVRAKPVLQAVPPAPSPLIADADRIHAPIPKKNAVAGLAVDMHDVAHVDGNAWSWPVDGRLAQGFNEGTGLLAKGIQISAPAGSPVVAAASGQVLYSGVGAQGYGKMIIVKHANNFLTAYTDLSSVDVRQGQKVERGEVLAEIGTINHESMLHFEVRKFGNPVDPTQYLPEEMKPS